jgi:exodeoxyribonuclease V gamma subunit
MTFDVIARERQLGDRSRRDDDRQLFLESLLSARQHLLITYVGQSQRTNKPLPPCGLVQELIDFISHTCALPGEARTLSELQRIEAMQTRLTLRHPLSGASPRYFGQDKDPRLFSYAAGSCEAARASERRADPPRPFALLKHPLVERPTQVTLRELERCLLRPARAFCQRRLNLMLGDDIAALPEREPFALDALERWKIATEWLEHALQGHPEASRFEVQRARGRLPHFVSGALAYDNLHGDVTQIQEVFATLVAEAQPRRIPIDLQLAGVRLSGTLGDVYPAAHARVQFSKLGSRHELRQFIRYLVLGCLAEQHPGLQLPGRSLLVAKGGEVACFELTPAECASTLQDLIELYVEATLAPLPVFAHASLCYAQKIHKGDPEEAALRAARSGYGDGKSLAGQANDLPDPYVEQLFGDFDQMLHLAGSRFVESSVRLYSALLRARRTA